MTNQRLSILMVIGIFLATSLVCSMAQEKQPERQPVQTQEKPTAALPKEITGKDGAPMVLIPAGEFQMGTDPAEIPELVQLARRYAFDAKANWFEDETPRHTVYLDAFYMDKYEVTNAQYRRFVQATGHREPEGVGLAEGRLISLISDFKPWSDENYNGDNQPVVYVS
jgi:formylglycine-generating enzyme required for sulfatase activity